MFFLLIPFSLVCAFVVKAAEPSFLFSPEVKSSTLGEAFDVEVRIDTVGQGVAGAGAKILYAKENLKVKNITKGPIFDDYPVAAFDNDEGKIIISGVRYPSSDLFKGEGLFATITFESIAVGSSNVKFIFQPGSTIDSNIAVTYGSGDILAKVNELKVVSSLSGGGSVSQEESKSTGASETSEKQGLFASLLKKLKDIGLTAEGVKLLIARITGKDLSMAEIAELQGTKTTIDQNQPSIAGVGFRSSQKPLERTLTIVLIAIVSIIFFTWLFYFIYLKRHKQAEEIQQIT